ncbi:MAG: Vitamin B12 dependent methionine synthase activation subunit [Clostridia bacterium]|nr:Vitamin B12 dependent methionine synthase activation subunit [Clostridia bacterium]
MVFTKTYDAPPVRKSEVLRYAGCKSEGDLPAGFLDLCINEAANQLAYKVCFCIFDININGDICDLGGEAVRSRDLCKNLNGSKQAVIFAATVGVGIDRLIAKYGTVEPSRAVVLAAVGAERIEALCDTFCADMAAQTGLYLKPRFSPGYGDLPLSFQKRIFALLDCQKHIGLGLGDSMLMSPSKSVTAIAGLCENAAQSISKCDICEKRDCAFKAGRIHAGFRGEK